MKHFEYTALTWKHTPKDRKEAPLSFKTGCWSFDKTEKRKLVLS